MSASQQRQKTTSQNAADAAVPAGLSGVLSVFQMPYHPDESIDFETLEREIDWILAQGADGLVMAMVSEVLRLTEIERRDVAERICRQVVGRGAVVISVGAEFTRLAVELAKHAEASGATGLMAMPPLSIALPESEVLKYYRSIVRATRLPLVVQDASSYVGRPLSLATQSRLLDEFGDQIYFKPEAQPIGQRLSQLRADTKGRARVFEGSGGIALVDSYHRGIVGTMPGAEIIRYIVALWSALEAGDTRKINRLAMPIGALVALQHGLDGFLAIEKHLLMRQGLFVNEMVRGPVGFQLDDETRREADRLFDLLELASTENNS
jgi:dihydrodipicolinate synthase/N-acetylneuraminate lyase